MGIKSAVLVVQPPPEGSAIPRHEIETIIEAAVAEAKEKGIKGFAVTPFLLKRVSELSSGTSLTTNLALLHKNVNLAAEIAKYLVIPKGNQVI
jgi:pseudouridine-5'-phosphate glycosidase